MKAPARLLLTPRGNGLNASLATGTSAPTWTTGKYGRALNFNQTNSFAQVTNNNALSPNQVTVSAWIYPTSLAGQDYKRIVDKNSSVDTGEYTLWMYNTGTIIWYVNNWTHGYVVSPSSVPLNQWTHIAGTFTNGSLKLYINGVLSVGGTSSDTTITTTSTNVFIGNRGSLDRPFLGKLDDIRIYNYARTQKQIVEDMNAGHPAGGSPVGSQIGYWKFDEGFGTVANNSGNGGIGLSGLFGAGTSAPTWTSDGKFGKALKFNGATSYVDISNPAINWQSRNRTISMWVKPDSTDLTGDHDLLTGYSTNFNYSRLRLRYRNGKFFFRFMVYPGPTLVDLTSTTSPVAGQWYHLVVTWDDNNYYMYVNGQQESTFAHSAITVDTSMIYTTIGADLDNDPAGFTNGLIDEVKIYNLALSADEVKIDYNKGSAIAANSFSSGGTGNTAPSSANSQLYCVPERYCRLRSPYRRVEFRRRHRFHRL